MTSPELTSLKEEVKNFHTNKNQGTQHLFQGLVDLAEGLAHRVEELEKKNDITPTEGS